MTRVLALEKHMEALTVMVSQLTKTHVDQTKQVVTDFERIQERFVLIQKQITEIQQSQSQCPGPVVVDIEKVPRK